MKSTNPRPYTTLLLQRFIRRYKKDNPNTKIEKTLNLYRFRVANKVVAIYPCNRHSQYLIITCFEWGKPTLDFHIKVITIEDIEMKFKRFVYDKPNKNRVFAHAAPPEIIDRQKDAKGVNSTEKRAITL